MKEGKKEGGEMRLKKVSSAQFAWSELSVSVEGLERKETLSPREVRKEN